MIRTQTLVPFEDAEERAQAFPYANGTTAPISYRDGSKARRPERLPLTPAPTEIAPYPIGALGPVLGRAAAAMPARSAFPMRWRLSRFSARRPSLRRTIATC